MSCIGPCVEHAISRSREILGYGVTLEDVRGFALQIIEQGGWPTEHPRGEVVPMAAARPGDLVLIRSAIGSGHLGVMVDASTVEDLREHGVCRFPLRRLRALVLQVWRVKP